ncbi:MAG TPA: CbiX/SirB N-terminal domain-containing protein [Thermoanaerobaculia bacterium]
MDAILLFSHGSVLCGAERNLLAVAERMRARGDAPVVEVGFLNYIEPLFATAVRRCVDAGATRVRIAPYFLIAGKFVVQDLPAAIAAVREEHPAVEFSVAEVIGFHPALAEAIVSSAENARPTSAWRGELAASAEWCRENPKCPLHGSAGCKGSA